MIPSVCVDLIFRRFETASFEKGEYVAKQGEEASHIYIIKRGKVELRIADSDRIVKKREFHLGDCFGEAAMLSLVNNTACLRAVSQSFAAKNTAEMWRPVDSSALWQGASEASGRGK